MEASMEPRQTALVLIGFQNDYFADDGILRDVIENRSQLVTNMVDLVEHLRSLPILIVNTPVIFAPDYSELVEPVGILKIVKEAGAFRAGTKGAETILELCRFGERIVEVPGKRGLNAFSNTDLDHLLRARAINNVILAGVATSICIDSTGRSAYERGYKVFVLSDCTAGRSSFEQEFYCEKIFPLYAEVVARSELMSRLGVAA
jgi:nicotinamidase-related amidase